MQDLLDPAEVFAAPATLKRPDTSALTLPERAAVALQSGSHEKKILLMVAEAKTITEVKNADGRAQCHATYMTFKKARTSIAAVAAAAREDATAFSRAVIAEENRLKALITAEEERLLKLRDDWDEAQEAQRQAKLKAEQERIAAIRARINAVRNLTTDIVGKTGDELQVMLDSISGVPDVASFAEFGTEYLNALESTQDYLVRAVNYARDTETRAAQAAAERAALEAKRAELEAEREAMRKKMATLKAERDALEAQQMLAAESAVLPEEVTTAPSELLQPATLAEPAIAHTTGAVIDCTSAIATVNSNGPIYGGGTVRASHSRGHTQPQAPELIRVIASYYSVTQETALAWLRAAEFDKHGA